MKKSDRRFIASEPNDGEGGTNPFAIVVCGNELRVQFASHQNIQTNAVRTGAPNGCSQERPMSISGNQYYRVLPNAPSAFRHTSSYSFSKNMSCPHGLNVTEPSVEESPGYEDDEWAAMSVDRQRTAIRCSSGCNSSVHLPEGFVTFPITSPVAEIERRAQTGKVPGSTTGSGGAHNPDINPAAKLPDAAIK